MLMLIFHLLSSLTYSLLLLSIEEHPERDKCDMEVTKRFEEMTMFSVD